MPIGGLISSAMGLATSPLALLGGAGAAGPVGAPGPTGATGALTVPGTGTGGVGGVLSGAVGGVVGTTMGAAATAVAIPMQFVEAGLNVATGLLNVFDPATGEQQVDLTGFGGGNGRFSKRTIVQTLDQSTGQISQKIMSGAPHIMNSDIRAAKKVFRQSAKLHSRMPRRTVKESETTKLKNAAVSKALQNVQSGDCCPPACK